MLFCDFTVTPENGYNRYVCKTCNFTCYTQKEKILRRCIPKKYPPGTSLSEVLRFIGFRHTVKCSCTYFVKRMNKKGLKWCKNHVPQIVRWLQHSATERKLPFSIFIAKTIIWQALRNSQ